MCLPNCRATNFCQIAVGFPAPKTTLRVAMVQRRRLHTQSRKPETSARNGRRMAVLSAPNRAHTHGVSKTGVPTWFSGGRGRESPASSPGADTRAHKDTQSHKAKTKATMTHATAQIWGSSGVKPVGAGGAQVGVEGSQMPAGRWESGARKSPKLEVAMCHGPPQSVGGATRAWEVCNPN